MKQRVLLALVCLLVLIGCGPGEVELSGEVFVVMKNGGSVKLGLVPVTVYTEEEITKIIEAKRNEIKQFRKGKEEELKKIQTGRPELEASMNKSLEIWKRDQAQVKKIEAAMPAPSATNIYEPTGAGPAQQADPKYAAWSQVYMQACQLEADSKTKYEAAQGKLDKLDADILRVVLEARGKVVRPVAWYFEGLPKSKINTLTNADGQFSFKVPKSKRVAVIAAGQREIVGEKEEYYWAVWVPLDSQPKKILLSNNNFVFDSPDCAFIKLENP